MAGKNRRRHSRSSASSKCPLLATLCAVHMLCQPRGAEACGFESFNRLTPILATCCESTKAKNCSAGFPSTCALACGKLLVPFYNDCAPMLRSMPPQNFPFKLKELKGFVHGCEHTQELFQFSTATCAASAQAKEQRALDVSAACCSQQGTNVCNHAVPWKCRSACTPHPGPCTVLPTYVLTLHVCCVWIASRAGDAQCAITYVPFFDDCLKHDAALSISQLHKYTVLYEQCANLGDNEVGVLMADLSLLVDNPK
jgi:hypothetical protein